MRTLASPDDRPLTGLAESTPLRLLILFVILLFAATLSLGSGPASLSLASIFDALVGRGDPLTRTILIDLRLPRALLALLVGGGLAMSGAVFQALLRNPLADPYVLGVSGGAAVGAVTAIIAGLVSVAAWSLPLAAFAGAVLAIGLVFLVAARAGRTFDTRILLLAGVVVGAFFNALILLLLTFANLETFRSAVFWMMGSLLDAGWGTVLLAAAYVLPLSVALATLARALNLLALGDDTALFLGTRVEHVKIATYLIASLLVAATVAACGVIGFVGLIVPHALRMVWGSDHRFLLPASFLAGAAFLLLADTAARTVAAPAELPVGVITALVGVPLFIVILVRSRR
ncbi:MAG: iron ABC transporter permease [Gemmatimonadota bacterium]